MKIYFDTCSWNRPWDDQDDPQISADTTAIDTIIAEAMRGGHRITGGDAVDFELGNIKDAALRADIMGFYERTIDGRARLTPADLERALWLQAEGLGRLDSQHLAAAEAADVDFLITTDMDFERIVTKKKLSRVKVIFPLTFLTEGI